MTDKLVTAHGEEIVYTDYAKDGKMLSVRGSVIDLTAHLTDDERCKLIIMLGGRP